ncbi:Inner membrane protein PPF-1, chloroplastic [Turnera subulata]|uniref:Inner membrane protein PPF-1, chloroplastic n=1 Tax=Turnera subulata TaxID=218843 RepID=A0A9Q0JK04_9ROSI|nr:Inner membrane protein PPF-1, chloroplastic [Turnera subulata]
MAVISSPPPFVGTPLPSLSRHRRRHHHHRSGGLLLPHHRTRFVSTTRVRLSFHDLPPLPPVAHLDSSVDFASLLTRAEGLLYTLADAAVAGGGAEATADSAAAAQKNGGWFGFISDSMEFVLKILKDGLSAVHVPYAYGFAIILLTVIVKAATLPLTKQQVESTLAMQNLQPKLKAIQQRYKGNQERIQLETSRLYKQAGVNPLAGCLPTLATIPVFIGLYQALSNVANEGLLTEGFFWIPSLSGPTTIAARQSGSGISWLFPFVVIDSIMKLIVVFSSSVIYLKHFTFPIMKNLQLTFPMFCHFHNFFVHLDCPRGSKTRGCTSGYEFDCKIVRSWF